MQPNDGKRIEKNTSSINFSTVFVLPDGWEHANPSLNPTTAVRW